MESFGEGGCHSNFEFVLIEGGSDRRKWESGSGAGLAG
jgi:hypothetical protein